MAPNPVDEARLQVFRAFSTAFDRMAAQFTSGHALNFAKDFSRGFLSYSTARPHARARTPITATEETGRLPQRPKPLWPRRGWRRPLPASPDPHRGATRGAHVAKTLNLGIERMPQVARGDWAACLGAEAVEGFQKWHTYAVADCPRQLTNIWGSAVDYGQAIREEIKLRTGVEPVDVHEAKRHAEGSDQPTVTMIVWFKAAIQEIWRLFGTSRLARPITKNPRPTQCDNCWDYHSHFICDQNRRADAAAEKTIMVTTVIARRVRELLRALPGRPQGVPCQTQALTRPTRAAV
ncbi:ribonuclease H-like protein [Hirsutella rhossiliensis]